MGLEDMILDKVDLNGNKVPDRKELAPVVPKLVDAFAAGAQIADLKEVGPVLSGMSASLTAIEAKVGKVAMKDGKPELSAQEVLALATDEESQRALAELIVYAVQLKSAVNAEKLKETFEHLSSISKDLNAFAHPVKPKK